MRTSNVVLASCLTVATAHAEKVGIVVTGDASLLPQVTSQLERWMHDHGRTLVPGVLDPGAVGTMMDCFLLEDLGCAQRVVEARARARSVVYAKVEPGSNKSGTRDVKIIGYWFQQGHETLVEKRVCERCNDDRLFDTVDTLMMSLLAEPPLPVEGATRPTSNVTLPDPAAGQPASSTADARPALPAAAQAVTSDTSPAESARDDLWSGPLLGYGLLGVGGLALLGGVTMLAIDQDPDPTGQQRPTYRDTATAGALVGGLGAAALGAGLYLSLTRTARSQPLATIGRDAALVGWAGRF